jgi:multiple sugar transport system ATP-binding protein
MAIVRLDNLTRQFSKSAMISDISFTVPDGEFWVMVGPSGCGKSTILRMIAGLESITSGQIYIGDRAVNDIPARQRDVAMVFQNYALYPHMSVAENIAFGLKMRKANPAMIKERVQEVARILDIAHLLERKPKQLSGGQQQRVALGRAIARQPQVFLLDEPLSNLDAQLRDDTRAELKQLHQTVGITTLYVTHDQVEAMTLADRIVVLNQGRIQQIGSPQMIYTMPANRMVASFLGSPPMNLLQATLEDNCFVISGHRLACPEAVRSRFPNGAMFELGIRPEYLTIAQPTVRPEDAAASGLPVEVTVVEPLGRETMLRVKVLGVTPQAMPQALTLQVPISIPVQTGDRIYLQLDPSQIFLFDPKTGDRLHPNPGTIE